MITLYQDKNYYTFSDPVSHTSTSDWSKSIEEAVTNYLQNARAGYYDHSTFTDDHNYTILGTFTTLKNFKNNYPELFI